MRIVVVTVGGRGGGGKLYHWKGKEARGRREVFKALEGEGKDGGGGAV